MAKIYEETYNIFIDEIKKRKEFSLSEIEKILLEKTGTTRIAPCRDIRDWILSAKIRGELEEIAPFKYRWRKQVMNINIDEILNLLSDIFRKFGSEFFIIYDIDNKGNITVEMKTGWSVEGYNFETILNYMKEKGFQLRFIQSIENEVYFKFVKKLYEVNEDKEKEEYERLLNEYAPCNKDYPELSIKDWSIIEKNGKKYLFVELEHGEIINIRVEIDFEDFIDMVKEIESGKTTMPL